MVNILYLYPKQSASKGTGGTSASCPAASFLSVPTRYPTSIRVTLDINNHPRLAAFDSRFAKEPDDDADLTALAKGIAGDFFDLTVRVVQSSDGGVYAFIDPHYSGVTTFAVGGRVALLDRHFGAGGFLLSLIEECPLEVWNPYSVLERSSSGYGGWEWSEQHKLRTWDLPSSEWNGVPDLPPNLTKIVQDCMDASVAWEDNWKDHDDISMFPIGMAVWNNTVPWQNRATKHNRDFGIERGNDVSWLALDELGQYHMETGLHSTCTELIHSIERLEKILELSVPFIKLYKYLSHETEEISYHCTF